MALYDTELEYQGDHERVDPNDYAGGDHWRSIVLFFRNTHALSMSTDYTDYGSRKLAQNKPHPSTGRP